MDKREAGALGGIRLMLLNNAEPIKLAIYVTPAVAAYIWINGLYLQADSERARAESERQQAEARSLSGK